MLLLFSCSFVSDFLPPHVLQHTPAFPLLHHLPELAQTYIHRISVAIQPPHPLSPLLLLPSIFTVSGSFLMSWLFLSGSQSTVVSASTSVLPMNIQGWFPLGLTCLISLQSKGFSRVFSNTTVQKHQFFGAQPFLWSNFHIHTWLLEKPHLWLDRTLLAK